MKVNALKRTFLEYRTLTEGTSKFEIKVKMSGLGTKLIAVHAEDARSAQKMAQEIFGKSNVISYPKKA